MKIAMSRAKKSLATVWTIWFILIFLLFVVQGIWGKYEGKNKEIWAWFLSALMPSVSLIIGIFAADQREKPEKKEHVDIFLYRLAMLFSVCYLFVVSLTILLEWRSGLSTVAYYEMSNLWVGPFQGIVIGVLTYFFRQRGA